MNLKSLTDAELQHRLESLTAAERGNLIAVLRCLREVDRRKLFSAFGFTSLFDYCTKKLCYAEDQAQRRIIAMRIIRDLPQIESKIESGKLTLSNLGLAQSFFQREAKFGNRVFSKTEKLDLLSGLCELSARQAATYLLERSVLGSAPFIEREKVVSKDEVEFRFRTRLEVTDLVKRLKSLRAHKNPGLTTGELFHLLCGVGIEKWQENQPATSRDAGRKPTLRQQVFTRDNHQCTNCASTHALELDHIIPKAKGGPDTLENLRVLCRACNQRAAINEYGEEKMSQYL